MATAPTSPSNPTPGSAGSGGGGGARPAGRPNAPGAAFRPATNAPGGARPASSVPGSSAPKPDIKPVAPDASDSDRMRKPGAAMRNNTASTAPTAKHPPVNPNAISGNLPKAVNPNSVSGTLPKAVNPNSVSGNLPKIGGRPPSGKAPPSDLAARREALGLSSMKPSEMIAGLDEAAARAEKLEKREEAKRKGGGNTLNTALHVDDTGKKWSRMVLLSLAGVIALVVLIGAGMIYLSNRKSLSPAEGNQLTRQWVRDLGLIAQKMKPFELDEKPPLDKVKERLTEGINAELDDVKATIKAQEDVHRPPSSRDIEWKEELLELQKYQDAWAQPFMFNLDDDKLTISAKGKSEPGRSIDPVIVKLPRRKPSK